MPDDAFCVDLPMVVKARPDLGERVICVAASNPQVDSEGDVILQQALLGSADRFVKSGHLDIDHISEIGGRYGLTNLNEWVIGKPREVVDEGDGTTSVIAELNGCAKADMVWAEISAGSTAWRASIYGFPTLNGLIDASVEKCEEAPDARRYVVKSMDWRSLALTKRPVNDSLTGSARIISAKAFAKAYLDPQFVQGLGKAEPLTAPGQFLFPPRNRFELLGQYTHFIQKGLSPYAGPGSEMGNSVAGFRDHFAVVCCMDSDQADIMALALMQLLKRYQ